MTTQIPAVRAAVGVPSPTPSPGLSASGARSGHVRAPLDRRALVDVYALAALGAAAALVPVAGAYGLGTLAGGGTLVAAVWLSVLALAGWVRPARVLLAAGILLAALVALLAVLAHTTGIPVGALRTPAPFHGAVVAGVGLDVAAVLTGLLLLAGFAGPAPARRWLTPFAGALVLAVAVPAVVAGGNVAPAASDAGTVSTAHDHGSEVPLTPYEAYTAGMNQSEIDAAIAGEVDWITNYIVTHPTRAELRAGTTPDHNLVASVVDAGVRAAISDTAPSALTGEGDHNHSGLAPWQPLTDPATRAALATALEQAHLAALAAPTAADAVRQGYVQITPYIPGIGAHYLKVSYLLGPLDPAKPQMLLYAGNGPTAPVVGVSYLQLGPAASPPAGLPGPNDVWHYHAGLCRVSRMIIPVAEPATTTCPLIGGTVGDLTSGLGGADSRLWMMHAWVVLGWESPWGTFSAANPELTLAAGVGH
jgi:hypothetical protein